MAPVLTVLSAVASIGGGILGAAQASAQAKQRNNELQAQANIANINAGIMQNNANLEASREQDQLRDAQRRANLAEGTTIAQAGANGMFGGSSLDVLADISTQSAFEQSSIVRERTSAQTNDIAQSKMQSYQASVDQSQKQSGAGNVLGALIGGFGSAASTITGGIEKGVFS